MMKTIAVSPGKPPVSVEMTEIEIAQKSIDAQTVTEEIRTPSLVERLNLLEDLINDILDRGIDAVKEDRK